MINLETKLAKAAWDLGPISKTSIPEDVLHELINDFISQNEDVSVCTIDRLEELNTYTVVVEAKESIELYTDWMQTFEVHGYEAPFLVVDGY